MGTNWEQTKIFSLYEILSVLFSVLSVDPAGCWVGSKAVARHQSRVAALADLGWLRYCCVCVVGMREGRALCPLGACCSGAIAAMALANVGGRCRNAAQGVFLGAPFPGAAGNGCEWHAGNSGTAPYSADLQSKSWAARPVQWVFRPAGWCSGACGAPASCAIRLHRFVCGRCCLCAAWLCRSGR